MKIYVYVTKTGFQTKNFNRANRILELSQNANGETIQKIESHWKKLHLQLL